MISTFNLRKLNDLLKDFYTLTQIRITVFNDTFRELTAYPEHIAPFCQIIRTSPEALNACLCCDKNACEQASRQHAPYTYCCHAGLTECIVPIYLGNIVIGYLFFGHVFSYPTHEEGWKSIRERCLPYGLDMDALRDALYQQPVISEEYISSASHIMRSVAAYLCMERMVSRYRLTIILLHIIRKISVCARSAITFRLEGLCSMRFQSKIMELELRNISGICGLKKQKYCWPSIRNFGSAKLLLHVGLMIIITLSPYSNDWLENLQDSSDKISENMTRKKRRLPPWCI